jgi:hypothetical protein
MRHYTPKKIPPDYSGNRIDIRHDLSRDLSAQKYYKPHEHTDKNDYAEAMRKNAKLEDRAHVQLLLHKALASALE